MVNNDSTIKKYGIEFPLSEMFVSFQGEGQYQGRNALFVRFRGCNLRCSFCDTKVTWAGQEGEDAGHVQAILHDIEEMKQKYNFNTIVFTGGETMLHFDKIMDILLLSSKLLETTQVAIETNGTLSYMLRRYLDENNSEFNDIISKMLFTISPKVFAEMLYSEDDKGVLNTYEENITMRDIENVCTAWADFESPEAPNAPDKASVSLLAVLSEYKLRDNIELKFVVDAKDITSLDQVTELLTFPLYNYIKTSQVYIQPMGTTQEAITCSKEVIDAIIARGYNFSPRLHVLLGVF